MLFLKALLKHLLQLVKIKLRQVLHYALYKLSRHLQVFVEPVPNLLRYLLRSLDTLEELSKRHIEFIIISFTFYEYGPAEVIESTEARLSQSLLKRVHKSHPLIKRDLKPPLPQQIEKFYKHIEPL